MNIPVSVLRWRRAVQWLVLAGLCLLPWANAKGWNAVMGNFYALYVGGVPFADPVGVLQNLATGYAPGWKLWLGAGLALALALALGRVFCGWVCPYGLLSELLWIGQGRGGKAAARAAGHIVDKGRAMDSRWTVRGAATVFGLAVTAVLGLPVLNMLSAPGSISLAPLVMLDGWHVALFTLAPPLLLLALDAVLGTRWWCRYGCPQALLLMVAAWLGRRLGGRRMLAVRWTAGRCSCKAGDEPCATACSMALRPRGKYGPALAHCVQCGDCVTACSLRGKALVLGTAEAAPEKE